jgi:mono/diheme cytochrome c family protein
MPWSLRNALLFGVVMAAALVIVSARGFAQQHDASQHAAGTHTHADAAKLKNPVPVNAASLATGKKLFTTNCASCHGDTGKGDGKSAATLNPKPSDLTDSTWKHGPSDGEMFTVIRDGARQTSMRGYAGKLTSQELWSVVNYVRSLGPAANKTQ